MAGTTDSWLKALDRLDLRLRAYEDEESEDDRTDARSKEFQATLQDVCSVVRDAEREGCPDLSTIIEKADEVLQNALEYTRREESELSASSFAHSEETPLVKDSLDYIGAYMVDALEELWRILRPNAGPVPHHNPPGVPMTHIPAWPNTPHPHPLTTRLSRFRDGISPNITSTTPLAHTIYQARAQLTVDRLAPPCSLSVSSGGSILALATASGWKQRESCLEYYLLGQRSDQELRGEAFDPGFTQVARHITTDESRKLIFIADEDRVKSFSYATRRTTGRRRRDRNLPNIHTMNSGRHDGAILVLPNGRLFRAGKGQAAIWNLDGLETHQDHPGELIGPGEVCLEDVWRDNDDDEIEQSTGSVPTTTTPFGVTDLIPHVLVLHQPTGNILFSSHEDNGDRSACAMADLEAGGRPVTRYIGHGAAAWRISTDAGNPNVFVTASEDGYARMFDVRHALPVLTFGVDKEGGLSPEAILVHPDGVPTLFTGGVDSQQVKLWDIRAKACVYELSTGNNQVNGLAWDATRSTLYVATECQNVNRMGDRMDYRRARVPRWATEHSVGAQWKWYQEAVERGETIPDGVDPTQIPSTASKDEDEDEWEDEDEDEDDEDDDDDLYDDWDEMRWPKKAFHKEDHFGYAFDAGLHALFRWKFTDSPDFSQLPPSTGV